MPRNAGENAVKQLDERSKKEWEKGGGDVEQADGSGKVQGSIAARPTKSHAEKFRQAK